MVLIVRIILANLDVSQVVESFFHDIKGRVFGKD